MKMHFKGGAQIEIELNDSLAATAIKKIYKHLQHVPLDFKTWDNPFYLDFVTMEELVQALIVSGGKLGVPVTKEECIPFRQSYYNQLHKIYEIGYNGDPTWLDFHEHIHLCELYHRRVESRTVSIDYRERAGPLTAPFDLSYLSNVVTDLVPGTAYIEWAELGKDPYDYWVSKEPDDLDRICQLVKPWLHFKPKIRITTQYTNRIAKIDQGFHAWWSQYETDWCAHWGLNAWPIEAIKGVIPIGITKEIESMFTLFQQQVPIERISL